MKVLMGHFGHEANTFSSNKTSYEDYIAKGAFFGDEVLKIHSGKPTYSGGVIKAASEEGIELIPTVDHTTAAPTLSAECVDRMLEHILPVCKVHKDEIDGICFSLHGAGVSEQTDDLEGYVLEKLRAIVGPDMPITVSLDLHGNISQKMVDLSNGLFGIKKYPHVDKFDAGYLAMKTLTRILKGECKPETALVRLPILLPCGAGFTYGEPFVSMEKYFKDFCQENGLIDATFFHGFPYADVPSSSSSVVVVAENGAYEAARHLAKYVWDKRDFFSPEILSPAQALDRSESVTEPGYIVINEVSDNPGGGAPGDGTHLLREMLRRNLPSSIFGYIFDPAAAAEIHKHKVGDHIDLKLGGKTEKMHGEPLELKDVLICNLSNGDFIHTTPNRKGIPTSMKKSARIRVDNVDIVVGSVLNQTFDDRPFLITGADIEQYRYVGLKSSNHFRSFFQSRAAAIITADPPGLQTSDLSIFEYKKITRPIFPLDKDVRFE